MKTPEELFLWGAEVHSVEKIESAFQRELDPRASIRGRTPVQWLVEGMYLRSERFVACLRAILERGGDIQDRPLRAVLLDDGDALGQELHRDPTACDRRYDLDCAFTPLRGATLLHVAAEHGSLDAVRCLLDHGADLEAAAAVDEDGMGGQTPIFHTVNQHQNFGRPALDLLLERGASTEVRIHGLHWGLGFEWETALFDLTPLSYCLCGLLPQFQRREEDLYDNARRILEARGASAPIRNVPNRYLAEPPA